MIRIRGLAEKRRELQRVQEKLRRLGPVMDACAADLRGFIEERFATQTTPSGRAWPRPKGRGAGALNRSGELRASVYATPTNRGVRFGVRAPYGVFHQRGGRQFLPVQLRGVQWVRIGTGLAGPLWEGIQLRIRNFVLGTDSFLGTVRATFRAAFGGEAPSRGAGRVQIRRAR